MYEKYHLRTAKKPFVITYFWVSSEIMMKNYKKIEK